MAEIFISWSSKDADIVLPVIRRLENHGLDVMQFMADLDAGNITDAVQGYVEDARLMVMFVSEQTNEAPWLKRETEWAAYRQTEQRRKELFPILKMIPVLIGNVDLGKLNYFLEKNDDQKRLKVPAPAANAVNAAEAGDVQPAEAVAAGVLSEAALQNLVLRICDTLNRPKPLVIPTLLLAMSHAQAAAHLSTPGEQDKLRNLCAAAGMDPFPGLTAMLLGRYGADADAFRPFPDRSPLKEIVDAALKPINDERDESQPRLWLWWCRDALLGPPGVERDFVMDRIGRGSSLLILDSISASHPVVQQQYSDATGVDTGQRQSLLWVPPFTSHTSAFETLIESLLQNPPRLRQEYLRWGEKGREPHPFLDLATPRSLRSWIFGALRAIADEPAVSPTARAGGGLRRGPKASPHAALGAGLR